MYLSIEKKNREIINYFFADNLYNLKKNIKEFDYFNQPVNANLHCEKESFSYSELLELKNSLLKNNIFLICIFSNNRESLITAKSLKLDAIYLNNRFDKSYPKTLSKINNEDLTHIGVVRSGDQISSNGNLIIVGDVNPGALITARKNIYVWGKLYGVAFAGKNGSYASTISALYLNALQLRINKIVAVGPKEKPKSNYPEVALIEKGKIIIKPYLLNS